jgi:OmpA-like transmembrane domain
MNTLPGILVALVASNLLVSIASASGFYAGAEFGGSSVPDMKGSAFRAMVNSGYSSTTVSQDTGSGQAAVFAGQWVTDNFGWEASLVSLGSIRGRIAANNGTSTIFTSYRYSAGAISLAAMGGINVAARGKIFFKAGAYGASVTYDGPTSTVTAHGAGPMIGGGFSYVVMKHLTARVEAANYIGVRYPNFEFFTPANSTTNTNVTTLSVGAAYEF